jgi:hypothetical protein
MSGSVGRLGQWPLLVSSIRGAVIRPEQPDKRDDRLPWRGPCRMPGVGHHLGVAGELHHCDMPAGPVAIGAEDAPPGGTVGADGGGPPVDDSAPFGDAVGVESAGTAPTPAASGSQSEPLRHFSQVPLMVFPSSLKVPVKHCRKSRGVKSGDSRVSVHTPPARVTAPSRGFTVRLGPDCWAAGPPARSGRPGRWPGPGPVAAAWPGCWPHGS